MLTQLTNALTNAFGGNSNTITPHNLGVGPSLAVPSRVPGELRRVMQLPGHVSRNSVQDEAYKAGKMQAQAKLISELVKARAQQMRSLQAMHGSHLQHHKNMLNTERGIVQAQAKHGKFIEDHLLHVGTSKAELSGYQAAFRNAETLVG